MPGMMDRENKGHAGEGQKSLRRATSVIGMAPDVDPTTWDHTEIDRYGLGKGKQAGVFVHVSLTPLGYGVCTVCSTRAVSVLQALPH